MKARATRRPKPPAAFASEKAARANIEFKLKLLQGALSVAASSRNDAGPETESELVHTIELSDCPGSARQFNAWKHSDLGEELQQRINTFQSNGQKTLKKNGDLAELVQRALATVSARKRREAKRPTKIETMASLRAERDEHELLKRIAINELVFERDTFEEEISKEKKLTQRATNSEAEALRQLAAVRAELEATKSRLAETDAKLAAAEAKLGIKRPAKPDNVRSMAAKRKAAAEQAQ